jgi:hypothetical protein
MVEVGLVMLQYHRRNCTLIHPDPCHLHILCRMLPGKRWGDLGEGSSMNFLTEL